MVIPFPQIDPVLIHLGPLAIRWYAIAYIAGLLIGWWMVLAMVRQKSTEARPLLALPAEDGATINACAQTLVDNNASAVTRRAHSSAPCQCGGVRACR